MSAIRGNQLVALRWATVRSVHWPPALAAVAVVTGLVTWQDEAFDGSGSALVMLRSVVVLLGVGAVFVVDDAAAVSVAATPTPLWWRQLLRYGVAVAIVLPTWLIVLAYARSNQPELPWFRLTLELTALVAFGLAVGAVATRWLDAIDPGMTAALAVLGLTFFGANLPPRFALFTAPDSPPWGPSTLRWAGVLITAVAVLIATNRDPARPRPLHRNRQAETSEAAPSLT